MSHPPRSLLFVSGERPDRFDKAMAAGADAVCIDLEDAVHPDRKDAARAAAIAYALQQGRTATARLALRVNPVRSLAGLQDVLAMAQAGVSFDLLLLPKVESAQELAMLHDWLPGAFGSLVALLETPMGVEHAAAIAAAVHGGAPRLTALMLGGADLSMELGAHFDWDGLFYARGRLLNAARSHGLQAWDVPFIDVADNAGLEQETRRVIGLGFDCKAAIHPSQVAPMHAVFRAAPADVAWARGVLAAAADGGNGAFLYQGKLVDAPLIKRAERIVQRAN